VPMGTVSPIWLYLKAKVQKSSSHAVRPRRRASERWEGAGKAAWVGRLHSVLRPPFQHKAHGTRQRESRRRSEQQCLNERGKQVTEAIRAGRTVAWDRQDERRMRQG